MDSFLNFVTPGSLGATGDCRALHPLRKPPWERPVTDRKNGCSERRAVGCWGRHGSTSLEEPDSAGLHENTARWCVMLTYAQLPSSETLTPFSKYLQAATHILHVLSSLPCTAIPTPPVAGHHKDRYRAKPDKSTTGHGDACGARERPTAGDVCTGHSKRITATLHTTDPISILHFEGS